MVYLPTFTINLSQMWLNTPVPWILWVILIGAYFTPGKPLYFVPFSFGPPGLVGVYSLGFLDSTKIHGAWLSLTSYARV